MQVWSKRSCFTTGSAVPWAPRRDHPGQVSTQSSSCECSQQLLPLLQKQLCSTPLLFVLHCLLKEKFCCFCVRTGQEIPFSHLDKQKFWRSVKNKLVGHSKKVSHFLGWPHRGHFPQTPKAIQARDLNAGFNSSEWSGYWAALEKGFLFVTCCWICFILHK